MKRTLFVAVWFPQYRHGKHVSCTLDPTMQRCRSDRNVNIVLMMMVVIMVMMLTIIVIKLNLVVAVVELRKKR